MDKNLPQQEIRSTETLGSVRLQVSRDNKFLIVEHVCAQEFSVKQIGFNLNDVKEYTCEGVLAPKPADYETYVNTVSDIQKQALQTNPGEK